MQVIGITGKRQHGKDTLASYIKQAHSNEKVLIYSFAQTLKDMCRILFNLSHDEVYHPALKEVRFAKPVNLDDYVPRLQKLTDLNNITTHGIVAWSPREILQYVGTDYIRTACPSYWVDYVMNLLKSDTGQWYDYVVIPDVRYINEVEAIKSFDESILAKVVRIDAPVDTCTHVSENALATFIPDITIGSLTGKFEIFSHVAPLINVNLVSIARDCCDYTSIENGLIKTPFTTDYYGY